ncbi:MAG TPA: hypothetical protein VEP90_08850, partial [Methylomirabilota bacterium]|nr:hypothetical protein [Methylomirabilota bacterium]
LLKAGHFVQVMIILPPQNVLCLIQEFPFHANYVEKFTYFRNSCFTLSEFLPTFVFYSAFQSPVELQ